LKADVAAQEITNFIICPDTALRLDDNKVDELWFGNNQAETTVQCGSTGELNNNCIVQGGTSHVWMKGGSSGGVNVTFRGIKFQNSTRWSAVVSYRCEAIFIDCEWSGNTNLWLNTNASGDPFTPWPGAAVNGDTYSELVFDNCKFLQNIGWAGTVATRGFSSYNNCLFQDNESRWIRNYGYTNSAIHLIESGQVSISNSCFIDNHSNGAGTVGLRHMRHMSKLLKNYNNFFNGNSVLTEMNSGGICTEVYKYDRYDGDYCIQSSEASCCELLEGPCPSPEPTPEPTPAPEPTQKTAQEEPTLFLRAASSPDSLSAGAIVGIAMGVLGAVGLGVILGFFINRRRNAKDTASFETGTNGKLEETEEQHSQPPGVDETANEDIEKE